MEMEFYAVRRSDEYDQSEILDLESPSKDVRRTYFGRPMLGAVIETSYLALTATDPTRPERILGFAAFDSSPSGELANVTSYPAFLEQKYGLPPASAFLFLTYFAQRQTTAGAASRPPVLKHLLHTMFTTLVHKSCCLLVLPKDVDIAKTEPALAKFFEQVVPHSTPRQVPKGSALAWKRLEQQFMKNAKTFRQFAVYQAKADAFFPAVHVRRARVEDHDDLEPILTAQVESVSSVFGDYFLAELIHDQDEHNVCLIAETASNGSTGQTRAVGLLAISDQLEVSTLQDSFALEALNDLGKCSVMALQANKVTPPRLVIAGPPAGGKGTQCELLVEAFSVLHLSTGDLLRAAVERGSPLGLQAQHYMDSGELVPDEMIVDVVLERLAGPDCEAQGWLLDGFPRTATQAQALLAAGFCPDVVVALNVPDDEVVRRIAGRRVDPETGKTYHLEFNPPPQDENVLARLIQRSDDTEATIRQRLATFHKHLDSVLCAFSTAPGSNGVETKIVAVNGLQSKHVVAQHVIDQTRMIKTAQKLRILINRGELMPPKLVISGPPAGGKGTQCEQLVALLGVVHLSTGDMLRQAIRERSSLGTQAQVYMEGGQLVPDELIVDVVLDRITQPDCESRGWLLDGFPRTATQAEALLAARGGKAAPDCLLVLDVPDKEVVRRIAGWRVDPDTGKTYHVEFNPPPLEVQARVIQRSDDTEETLQTRLEQFHAHSDGVMTAFAAHRGVSGATVQIVRVDGLQPPSSIAQAFLAPIFQRGVEAEARALHRTGAETLSDLARAEAHFNCFAITLFCVRDDAFERSSSADLLVAAFAAFPTRDYCLLTLPTNAPEPPCLAYFSQITPQPTSAFTHALYVLHRDAISFFCPHTSDGRHILHSVQINVQRFLPSDVNPADDTAELAPLLQGLDYSTRQALAHDLASANEEAEIDLADSPRHAAFVVRANDQVVGLIALDRQPEVATLLAHYFDIDRVARMELHRAKDLAFVRHLILNPVFAVCSRFVLLELMRHFRKTCLLFQVPTGLGTMTPNIATLTSFSAALQEFVLAPPRRGVHTNPRGMLRSATTDSGPIEEVDEEVKDDRERIRRAAVCAAFALFVLPKRLLSEPKITINQRVVLVGASDTALCCLARLASVPYLHFSNLTLVSPHGLTVAPMDGGECDPRNPQPFDFARKSTFTAVELEQYSLHTHVRVVERRMVRVDREIRAVVLQDGSCIPYDYLALTTGLQDGTCTSLGKFPRFVDEDLTGADGKVTAAAYYPPVVPRQMLALGDPSTAQKLHKALQKTRLSADNDQEEPREAIIVYGSSLLALQVIQALLIRGIRGDRIHHISPARDQGGGVFEDAVVRSELKKQYTKSGVSLHAAMKIVAIQTASGNDDELEGVHVVSTLDERKGSSPGLRDNANVSAMAEGVLMPCSWLLCCQHNDCDADIFRAVNESGLVYDGRLVVDGHMRTTDAHVLGAGSLCRFSRRFIAAKLHENYSSREGGELLAKSLLQLLDPLAVPEVPSEAGLLPGQPAQLTKAPLFPPPAMGSPVVRCAVIMGGKHYVQISVPAIANTLALQPLPTDTASQVPNVSLIGSDAHEMDDHSCSNTPTSSSKPYRYTCLLFDDVGVLNRLEYLGDETVSVRDLQNLVGLHETYLNSALASYAAGKVLDWISFFTEPWTSALYHDRFPIFRAKLRALLAKDNGVRSIAEDAAAFMRETGDTKGAMALTHERVGRGGTLLEPSTKRLVESQVLEFLSTNRDVLNMFLLPKGQPISK